MKQKAVVAAGSGGAGGLGRRNPRRPKAVVAMSGGVDSSVAAALMVEAGYDVTGVMLKLWQGEAANNESGCCNLSAAEDARRVADVLGIPFYVLNFAERFEDSVVRSFHEDYAAGRTPNPCVRCNQWIKFGTLMERADAMGADVLVTGHYARIRERAGRHALLRGVDARKDQSYVLWMLGPRDLARSRFPVGEMDKSETRALAAELGLRTATKPDSQEICFVRAGDMDAYVDSSMPDAARPGPLVDTAGNEIGRHRGLGHYTVGQRKGLGISLGVPVYVTAIDAATNRVTVGSRDDLLVHSFTAGELSFTGRALDGDRVLVQHRAHGDVAPGTIHRLEPGRAVISGDRRADRAVVLFDEPVEAIAPGQSAAFYDPAEPDLLLGGGILASTSASG